MEGAEKLYEPPLTQHLFQKASFLKIPISGTFELSPICNFDCRMCYVRQTPEQVKHHSRKMMTLEQWKALADELYGQGLLYLLLTGGEPLLWPDFWELYDYLSDKGFVVSINTNGSLITEQAVEHFQKHPPTRINITLYGATNETYEKLCRAKDGFTRVDQAIMGLKNAGVQVKLNCSLTPYNCRDLEKMVRYAEDRKLILSTNTYMFPPIRKDASMVGMNDRFTPEEAAWWHIRLRYLQYDQERFTEMLRGMVNGTVSPMGLDENCYDPVDGKVRCRAGSAAFWVTWDGYLVPCGMMTEPKIDLCTGVFMENWKKLVQATSEMTLSGVCTKCVNHDICHSCAAMAIAETGSSRGIPEYLCRMMEEMRRLAAEQLKIYGT